MKQPHLQLNNISKSVVRTVNGSLVRVQVLSGIDLTVNRGDLVTIMGTSGSGKTTLLRLINRLSEADSGTLLLNGRDIRVYPPVELRRKVGMVFQVPVMFKGSVRDNLSLGVKLWGQEVDIEALASDAGIPRHLLDAGAGQLSVGEKQRVCTARALANQPEVLLLDEPTSSLDSVSAARIEDLLMGLVKDRELTIIWVTHDRDQAKRIGGRQFMLDNGKLEAVHG